ncbi:hypothetical protein CHQ84_00375 [Francisella noatunensis subsp. orientalis]|uniref:Uncharacterized protein n=1 Tax=Francisella orientalis TaxID=299583 RepID=A0AAP6XBX3_9GAMM|nr:hypothetical protein [Francisella orientalis]AFJ42584.1 hypothetical protein OOM_0009 [Francisella orientalis str. Toba 04]APD41977.1 hypothetical protein BMT43_00045 [Francisella orientalis]MBK2005018.1 hypothetical protein [Francisella orientalis]MBK2006658.1 hypothetical protein [Francisella orientalis]MBK2007855.1 hypothetical protein [Francisella orientalis]
MKNFLITFIVILSFNSIYAKNLELMRQNIGNANQNTEQSSSKNKQQVSNQSHQLFNEYKNQS